MEHLDDEVKEAIESALMRVFLEVCLMGFIAGVLAGFGAAVLILK